ncbi:MAG TPA: non-ribosomal peptide synthetase [Natronosporangium sp.]|nr:non-ribosomal peptide synthetase [Natronosporangium sp.]
MSTRPPASGDPSWQASELAHVPFPHHDTTLGAAFAATARRHPDRPAVVTADRQFSYAELATMAGGIAARLADVPVHDADPHPRPFPGTAPVPPRVGLLLDHGADMVAAILGGLAAGWCYVPLDPTYPVERLRTMAAQAGLSVVLTHARHRELAAAVVEALPVTTELVEFDPLPPAPLHVRDVPPDQPAYVLFTSGSTGRPKGVTHSHRSVLHGITNHVNNLQISPADRTSLVTPFSYDMSISDLYGAVLSGAAVVPVDLRRYGLAYLARAVVERGVTIYHSTPTVFRYLVDYLVSTGGPEYRLPAVRVVLLGGEPATRQDLTLTRRHFAPDCRLINGYGATEATFTIQLHLPVGTEPPDLDDQVLPIGTPLAGYQPVLLDPDGNPLPETESGPAELGVRSAYLALGYWGDLEQTRARFGPDGTLYRTGDIVRRLPDGTFVYAGRGDRQVKVNGHRVELAEIEAHVTALPQVTRAVAVARPGPGGTTQVHVYAQPSRQADPPPTPEWLRARLAERLPDQLLPHRVLVVPELPLTVSGKVDVNALPAPPPPVAAGPAPVDGTEALVAQAWCEVLGLPAVGREVSFFDAGGTSLTLARLQYRLAQLTGVDVPLVRLLEHPTVAAMTRHLEGEQAESPLARAADRMAQRRAKRRDGRIPAQRSGQRHEVGR